MSHDFPQKILQDNRSVTMRMEMEVQKSKFIGTAQCGSTPLKFLQLRRQEAFGNNFMLCILCADIGQQKNDAFK